MLRLYKLNTGVFLPHIEYVMLAHRNKNSGKLGKTKVVALTGKFPILPELKLIIVNDEKRPEIIQ